MQPNVNQETNVSPAVTKRIEKTHHSREVSHHLWTFLVSLTLTAFAFAAVMLEIFDSKLALGMFLLILAIIQAMFQLFVWMHLNQKEHSMPILFIFSGVFVAILTVVALSILIFW
ncbi:cytochrome C oxidase subunit IV family protein [Bacillus horti]|uniref:Cytochrome c oxidase subunit 4 n=1 Tax=Caldalkalibacillus horti TaxID=77523 RepID=A0ABT9VUZ1_9BACI|nr:cytochrome C oxidase subunit IV family protein [Bacillus horti]MDQ0164813.1 cytochrome c oxidase subunit 4 [Bacillus horti]